jgi:hypothetical protein
MMNKKAITYYTLAAIFMLTIVLAIMHILAWPKMAEIPLAVSIFIQLMAGARYIYTNIIEKRDFTYLNLFSAYDGTAKNSNIG